MAAKVLVILLAAFQAVNCYKILALMNVPSHSHHNWNIVYLKALAERGHKVTYVGVDEYKNPPPNIRHILLEGAYEFYKDLNFTDFIGQDPYESLRGLMGWYIDTSKNQAQSQGFKQFIDVIKTEKFDVVVYDLGGSPYLLGCVDILGRPPMVGITAFGIPSWTMDATATPYPIANSPHFTYPLGRHLSFTDKLENAVFFMYSWYLRKYYLIPSEDEVSKKGFGATTRHLDEIEADMHINMVNANWAFDNAIPLAPGLIPIGGLHISKPKPLPQDIQQFLDNSKNGAVYFSLGSNIQSVLLQEWDIKALLSAFKQLAPLNILWKWENDTLPGKSSNVKFGKWLPQNDILAHPNVKLFITHGGMLSSQEAIYHGVPILGMPFFVDQHTNVMKAVSSGIGESLHAVNIQADAIVSMVKKIVENPAYKAQAVKLSSIFRDDMHSPLDRAVFYTEYAVRHQGAPHLKPPSFHLNWFQRGLYDIGLVFAIVFILFVVMVRKFLKLVMGAICGKSDKKLKRQ